MGTPWHLYYARGELWLVGDLYKFSKYCAYILMSQLKNTTDSTNEETATRYSQAQVTVGK